MEHHNLAQLLKEHAGDLTGFAEGVKALDHLTLDSSAMGNLEEAFQAQYASSPERDAAGSTIAKTVVYERMLESVRNHGKKDAFRDLFLSIGDQGWRPCQARVDQYILEHDRRSFQSYLHGIKNNLLYISKELESVKWVKNVKVEHQLWYRLTAVVNNAHLHTQIFERYAKMPLKDEPNRNS